MKSINNNNTEKKNEAWKTYNNITFYRLNMMSFLASEKNRNQIKLFASVNQY